MNARRRVWGIVPAAGRGSRIQPLAFSKELLPVGLRRDGRGRETPRAVGEYVVDRMITAGAGSICFVIAPDKADIVQYFGEVTAEVEFVYKVQQAPRGLCVAVFRAHDLIAENDIVLVGLPDTIWFPEDALNQLPDSALSLLLFPSTHPERFDSVSLDNVGRVRGIVVKAENPASNLVWGAMRMPGTVYHQMRNLWLSRMESDEYLGTLIQTLVEEGTTVLGFPIGTEYIDVGTLEGYQKAFVTLRSLETPLNQWSK